jgi:hypothetical protein
MQPFCNRWKQVRYLYWANNNIYYILFIHIYYCILFLFFCIYYLLHLLFITTWDGLFIVINITFLSSEASASSGIFYTFNTLFAVFFIFKYSIFLSIFNILLLLYNLHILFFVDCILYIQNISLFNIFLCTLKAQSSRG